MAMNEKSKSRMGSDLIPPVGSHSAAPGPEWDPIEISNPTTAGEPTE